MVFKTTIGKGNSLLYSLFVAGFLVRQSVDVGYDKQQGFYARNKEVPILTIVACSTFLAVGLGINVLDTLQTLAALVNRNTQLLNTIAKKQNINTESTIIETEITEEDSQNSNN